MPVDGTSHAHTYNQAVVEILVDEYPRDPLQARLHWMTDPTYKLCRLRSATCARLRCVGKKMSRAVEWFVFRSLAPNARVCHKPKWCAVKGPVTKELWWKQIDLRKQSVKMGVDAD